MSEEAKYWVCIIGPIKKSKLPDGADSPPRMAARNAVLEMTGEDTTCNSGWCDEAEYRQIMEAKYRTWKDKKKPRKEAVAKGTPKLFIGMEETNIGEFVSRCCGSPLSLEPLCRVACGRCGKSEKKPRHVPETKP